MVNICRASFNGSSDNKPNESRFNDDVFIHVVFSNNSIQTLLLENKQKVLTWKQKLLNIEKK